MEHSRHQQEFWGWVGNKAESSRSGETEFPPFPQKFLPTHLFSMYPCSPAFKKRSGQKSWQLLAAGRWPCCAGLDDLAANRKAWQPLIAMLSIFQHHVGNLRNETTAVQHSSGNHQCPFHSSNSKHLGMLAVTCLTMLKTSGAVEAALHALEQPAGLPECEGIQRAAFFSILAIRSGSPSPQLLAFFSALLAEHIFQFERWRQLAALGTCHLLCAHEIEAPILQMSALDTLAVIGKGNRLVINDPLTHFFKASCSCLILFDVVCHNCKHPDSSQHLLTVVFCPFGFYITSETMPAFVLLRGVSIFWIVFHCPEELRL